MHDGQILVTEDLIGLTAGVTPRFVKRYADVGREIAAAVESYARAVRARKFPEARHCYGGGREQQATPRKGSRRAGGDQ